MSMKKLLLPVVLFGTAISVIYWLYKKGKANIKFNNSSVVNKIYSVPEGQNEKNFQTLVTSEIFEQDKSECSQTIFKRHFEAGAIMKAAYQNIMEDFVEDFSEESITEKNEGAIAIKDISVIKELDSISDDLLK